MFVFPSMAVGCSVSPLLYPSGTSTIPLVWLIFLKIRMSLSKHGSLGCVVHGFALICICPILPTRRARHLFYVDLIHLLVRNYEI